MRLSRQERRGRQNKGYVAVVSHPESGEILLGDLLRLTGAPKPRDSSVRVYATTDRAVYAPGDALAILGLVASRHCKGPGPRRGAFRAIWSRFRLGEGLNLMLNHLEIASDSALGRATRCYEHDKNS